VLGARRELRRHRALRAARRALLAAVTALSGSLPLSLSIAASAHAQLAVEPRDARFWAGGAALLAAGMVLDERLHDAAAAHQSRGLSHVADAVDPLGRARYLLPALAVAVVVPRLAGRRALSDAALRVAAGYVAADGLESVVKPLVGRHRPDTMGGAWRFRPLGRGGAWGSFPSAHTTHAFAVAAGVSREAHRPWVSALCYATAAAVGAQRVYLRAHWASDVAGGALLAVAASRTTAGWLERRTSTSARGSRLELGPGSVAVALSF
jgi:membrane-associated phospholipid phosphatase